MKKSNREKVRTLRSKGKSLGEISKKLCLSRSCVQYHLRADDDPVKLYDKGKEHQKYLRRKRRGYYKR